MNETNVTPHSLRAWLLAARPKTLPASAAPVMIGLSVAAADPQVSFKALPAVACLLFALLQPNEELARLQDSGNFSKLMVLQEELKTLPFGEVWDAYCRFCGKPVDGQWYGKIEEYEQKVQVNRG